jgi:PAS domain S-box-containing protein/putative nucleotidyltransferase with HDIG domain
LTVKRMEGNPIVNVLLIEDNPGDARLIQEMLAEGGSAQFKLECVDRLSMGLARLVANGIGLVLLDLGLPDSQGFDTFAKIYAQAPRIPIVVLSGLTDENLAMKTVQEGAQDYIVKGQLESYGLVRTIRYAIERKHAEEELRGQALIFENIHDSIVVTDLEGNIIRWNPAAERMFGFYKDEVFHKTLGMLATRLAKGQLRDGRWDGEMNFTRKDGAEGICETTVIPLCDEQDNITAVFGVSHDITAYKRAEKALLEGEARYRELFDNMSSAVAVYEAIDDGKDFIFKDFNKAGERIEKVNREDFIGKSVLEVFPGVKEFGLFKVFQQVWKAGKAQHHPVTLYKDERIIGWRENYVYKLPSGEVVAVYDDVTERKQAEDALREKEETIRAFVETSKDWIWSIDLKGIHTYSNPAVENILGYTLDELIGKSSLKLMHDEDRETIQAKLPQWIKEKRGWANLVLKWRHKDGRWRWLESNAVPIFDRTGKLIGFRGVDRDISERKQAEEALRESERKLRLVTDQVTDVIWSMDLEGNFTFVTPSVERMIGYTVEEMLSLNFSQIVTPESHTMAMDLISKRIKVKKREPIILEMQQVCKDGSKEWCEITAIFATDDNRPSGIIGVTRDISERKRSEEKLQKSYDKLRDTMIATVNTLASTVEMRDPYTAGHQRRVTILACAMAEEMGLTEEQFDGLRMAGLVHDIGKFSVPVEILNKPGRISETEFNIIKYHSQAGYNILKEIEFPWPVAQIVLQHHERLDGSGYPQGLKNGGIMLEAKILAVADVVEAMASHRPYRPALGIDTALEEIAKNQGILYDPEIVDICKRLFIKKGFTFE